MEKIETEISFTLIMRKVRYCVKSLFLNLTESCGCKPNKWTDFQRRTRLFEDRRDTWIVSSLTENRRKGAAVNKG